ncbi:MAG: 16S rRNA (cytosine(1402)-N(4))-methyltransferase RsmH [Desulfonatronovibrionaceae bacterium]
MPLHLPVMPDETVKYLRPEAGGRFLDGTLGAGGHSLRILKSCGAKCSVLGIDLDQEALDAAQDNLSRFKEQVHLFQDSYANFDQCMLKMGWDLLDGALLDLGLSSLQLDMPEKGFSFLRDGPLDMRMGMAAGLEPASKLVERASFARLKKIIQEYGQEPLAGRVARAIIQERAKSRISTTLHLAEIVERAYPARRRAMARNHPATRTFQALRMAVNHEPENLEQFLNKIPDYLRPGARLVIISFHSLEDRKVKHFFRQEAKGCICPPQYPVCQCAHQQKFRILTKKPLVPSEDEIADNPRSRSAKLRAAERI